MVNEKALIDVTLNSQEAESQLKDLQSEMKRLIELKRKAEEAGDVAGYKKIDGELKKVSRSANKLINDHRSLEQTLKNLNGVSLKELRDAQRALTSQTEKLNRETKEYVEKSKQLKLVNAEISKVNAQYRSQGNFIGRAAEGFNRYFSIATAAIASFTGVALTIKSSVTAFALFDDKLSDVQKTTGLTKDQVKSLNAELEKIGTRTSQEGLLELARIAGKLGISAEKDVLGFVRAADKINVALTQDLGGNTEQAINDLGKLVDIFKLNDTYGIEDSLLKVGSAINSLGAAGTANEAYLVEFTKRIAGIAPSAGISIQKVLGLAATLDELGQTSEVSGTVVNNVIAAMFKDTATYADIAGMSLLAFTDLMNTDANEAFIKVLQGAKGSGAGFAEMAVNLDKLGLDGARSTGVLAVLANNIDKLREKQAYSNQEFAKGTSIIKEFNTKNENVQAELDKAKKAFSQVQRELGERLAPAYTSVIHKGSLMLKTTGAIVEFMFKYGKVLATATTAIVTYTIAVNAHNIVTKVYNSLTSAATLITKGFNTAVKTNPIGLLISLLTTVATGFILFSSKAGEAKKAQSEFNDVVRQGNDLLAGSKTLTERAAIAKNLSKEQLSSLQSDIAAQIKQEEDFHATLLQKAKKRLDDDAELKRIAEAKSQANISQIQKINLSAQYNARAQYLVKELEDENKTNQQRLANLKKTLAEVNNEFKGRPVDKPEGGGTEPGNTNSTAQAAIDLGYKQQLLALKTYYADKQHLQEEAHARELALELAHLQALAELETDEGKRIDLKIRIADAQVKYNEALAKAIPEMIKNEKQGDKLGTRLLETAKLTDYASQKQYEGVTATEAYNAKQMQQMQTIQMMGDVMTDYITSALNGQADNFASFGQTLILMSLQILKQMVPIWSAQILGFSLSSPESVATWGVAGMAKFAAITTLMYAGISAAEGAIKRNIDKKQEAAGNRKGYYSGGFTGYGPETEVAGLVHRKEYVINASTYQNPAVQPYIQRIREVQEGGNATTQPTAIATTADPELKALIAANLQMMEELKNKKLVVHTQLIKKDLETLDKIEKTSGL
jgi:TP901 family phage tail tape measure protein